MNQKEEENTLSISNSVIKHIVIAGGGVYGLNVYGALRQSHDSNFWNINNIESVYGTSVGSIFGTIICFKLDWDVLDEFIITRPWQNVFKIDMLNIVNSIQSLGILNIKTIEDLFLPLLKAKDLALDITMLQFYEHTQIELHLFATEIEEFKLVDISYKTHPDWKLVEAVYASSALPCLFSPLLKDNKSYCDGGFICNYPVYACYEKCENKDEIFGLRNYMLSNKNSLTEKSTLFDYILKLLITMIRKISINEECNIKHEIKLECSLVSIYDIYLVASSIDNRKNLIENGKEAWKKFEENLFVRI
jgi:predicted acylesterase/phospholipase RssA